MSKGKELGRVAGVPVTLAGTVVDQTPAIAANAVKSGYDAAQRIAFLLAADAAATNELTLNGTKR
ncbi:hypothetical protein [Paenarthrobacter nicotinovorans]|uniref:hypothetical protein n=1 Tax=Paenarthrobacter nicotinovorans TaxID=29320 RepID=UPI0024857D46|nr:hypothetical protein [Paenarthrobacter nicotinovorans]MDI2020469.1 hypothetical protein [Paenarthrobacter nicotinovorans]